MGINNLSNLSKKNLLKFTAFTVTALSLSILGHGNSVYAADNAVTDKASTESDMSTAQPQSASSNTYVLKSNTQENTAVQSSDSSATSPASAASIVNNSTAATSTHASSTATPASTVMDAANANSASAVSTTTSASDVTIASAASDATKSVTTSAASMVSSDNVTAASAAVTDNDEQSKDLNTEDSSTANAKASSASADAFSAAKAAVIANASADSLRSTKKIVADGLHTEKGVTYLYKNGVKQSGQQTINGVKYYFDPATKQMRTNYFLNQNGKTYYFDQTGHEYVDKFYSGWGHLYYFGKDGARFTKQFYNNWGHTYYFGEKGIRYTNQFYSGWGHLYYYGGNGALFVKQFYNNWGHTYYFGEKGIRYTNQFYSNWGHMYYFGGNGALVTNQAFKVGTKLYYTNNKGIISTGGRLTSDKSAVVNLAKQLASRHIPFIWAGASLSGMDCSGLVSYVYQHALNTTLPHNTVAQESHVIAKTVGQAQLGDLLFWGNHGSTYHVAIYIGNNQYIDAPKPGQSVGVRTISPYFMPAFAGTVK